MKFELESMMSRVNLFWGIDDFGSSDNDESIDDSPWNSKPEESMSEFDDFDDDDFDDDFDDTFEEDWEDDVEMDDADVFADLMKPKKAPPKPPAKKDAKKKK